MLLTIQEDVRRARLAVVAYDITCPKQAYRIRRVLDALHHAKQYSVYELLLTAPMFNGVLAELSVLLKFPDDLLAVWWPWDGMRMHLIGKQLMIAARFGQPCQESVVLPQNIGNFIVCYDISDPDALRAVAHELAPETAMVQRSVYWLRAPVSELTKLLMRCHTHLGENDRVWAYPLRGSQALWHVGTPATSILPITTHHWRKKP